MYFYNFLIRAADLDISRADFAQKWLFWTFPTSKNIVSVHVHYFSVFSLCESGYVSLRWRDRTWSSTILTLHWMGSKFTYFGWGEGAK